MWALLARTLLLAATGVVAGLVLNFARPDGVSFDVAPAAVCKVAAADPFADRVTPAQANALCSDPGVLLADARPVDRFARGHVAGAVHLPCAASGEVAASVPRLVGGFHTVIVYGDSTAEAETVADGLRRRIPTAGLRVAVLDGGFPAWEREGYACASGPCPACEEGAPQSHAHPAQAEGQAP